MALGLIVSLVGVANGQDEEDSLAGGGGFSIPDTRLARTLVARAGEHLVAERWNEALADLQTLLEEHGSELVVDQRIDPRGLPVHRGAAGWATEQLKNLPPEVTRLYRRRHGERARATLGLARGRSDRQAVIAVAERWPICETATTAWWTVGDLEFERGNLDVARWAWSRALWRRVEEAGLAGELDFDGAHQEDWREVSRRLESEGSPLHPGEAKRIEYAVAALDSDAPLAEMLPGVEPFNGSLRLPGEGEGTRGAPGPQASTWPRSFQIPAPRPLDGLNYENLFPIRVGDLVLLSNSLQLFAVGAYSGELRWQSEMPEGWARLDLDERGQFFTGISLPHTMIAPAASREIVVAALQVPVTDLTNVNFRNIAITTVIPDRRLYAYDVETGEELWNHHPPPRWDGETGSFIDRMSIAGPPIVVGSRVLAPVHRMYGRIEFYVACYDLETGALLWSTQLVSGQRELNMFARAETEFSAPPLRVEGDAVIALTQLGAVASLDLFSGRIHWETLYPQIRPPEYGPHSSRKLQNVWRNAPPVVADGVVIATPFDSRELLGLDLHTGEKRWTIRNSTIRSKARGDAGRSGRVDVLIGADERTVYFGGWPVIALRAAGGLYREAPGQLAWRYPSDRLRDDSRYAPRAVLLADRVIIPRRTERIEVDRYGGSLLSKKVPWKTGRSGNLLVEGGTLYTLTPQFLDGYFEWDVLLQRARDAHEADPEARPSTLYLSSLLAQRGRTESEAGRNDVARDWLDEALELLEPLLEAAPGDPEVRLETHRTLRSQGRVLNDLADTRSAARAFRRAREFAADPESLLDTLLEEYELVRGFEIDEQRAVLAEMESSSGRRALQVRLVDDGDSPRRWRLAPIVLEEDSDPYDPDVQALPVSLWIALERADLAATLEDAPTELFHLHRMIELWPDLEVRDGRLADHAAERSRDLIDRYGREIYEPFELRARELLEEARAGRDWQLLLAVGELYPQSLAGREANDDLLLWAIEEGDVGAVAEIVSGELPAVFAPELADERQIGLLLHVGAVMQRVGNDHYAGELYRTLAALAPELISPVPDHLGLSLKNLVAERDPVETTVPDAPPATFTADVLADPQSLNIGRFEYLGRVPPAEDGSAKAGEVLLYAKELHLQSRDVSLLAYSPETAGQIGAEPLWDKPIPRGEASSRWKYSIAFVPGAVVVSSRDGVYARERESGSYLWGWPAPDGNVESIRAAGGLILVTERHASSRDTLHALDRKTGERVWEAEIDRIRYGQYPVCGERRVVLLPRSQRTRGLVLDLFTGRTVLEFELPERVLSSAEDACWIEDGRLIVPWFLGGRSAARNRIVAVDLYDGELAWNVSFDDIAGGRRELRSVIQHDGHTYLLLMPQGGLEREGVRGIVVELHSRLGATARLGSVELEHGERPVGVQQELRVALDSPLLFLRSFAPGGTDLRLRALDLRYGSLRWTQRLKVSEKTLYGSPMREPATSETTVALAITTKTSSRFGRETSLYFLDRTTGRLQGNLLLDGRLGASADLSLKAIGNTLILAGRDLMQVMR